MGYCEKEIAIERERKRDRDGERERDGQSETDREKSASFAHPVAFENIHLISSTGRGLAFLPLTDWFGPPWAGGGLLAWCSMVLLLCLRETLSVRGSNMSLA